MSAAAATTHSSDEFCSLLDLNLSLHHYSTSNTPSPFQHNEHAVSPAVRKVVVDLTKIPSSEELEEDGGSQSQNSTLSTLSRKRLHPEKEAEEETRLQIPGQMNQASPSPRGGGGSDEDDCENSRKKLRLSRDQSLLLEDTFKDHNTLNPRRKQALAKQLGLSARQVKVWFQNRRARTKLKQTEAECEYMKRNCESLMDRVRRLQKEVDELRSLKMAPHIFMQMPPATTITFCPSCERVGIPTPNAFNVPLNAGCVGSVSGNLRPSSNSMVHKPF